jgi:hypothetical protein
MRAAPVVDDDVDDDDDVEDGDRDTLFSVICPEVLT